MKILFVCLGNICRSPMAEAVFNDLVKKRQEEHLFSSDSAGTAGYHIGHSPDFRTRKICEENKIEISHKGRKICKNDLQDYDLIVAMDQSNFSDIIQQLGLSGEESKKIRLMRDYEPGMSGLEVPDPYYGTLDDFRNVHAMLVKACQHLLDDLSKQVKPS